MKYLDKNGLTYFFQKVKALIPTKTSQITNDSNFAVDSSYVHTDNNFTNSLKDVVEGLDYEQVDTWNDN